MNHKNLPARKKSLARVQKQFRVWRSSRQRGTAIPQQLWQAAAELSEQHSVSKIAETLGLDYVKLRERIESSRSMESEQAWMGVAGNGFVEVGAVPGNSNIECLVEVEDGTGRKLKMRLIGTSGVEAAEIARVLWETGR